MPSTFRTGATSPVATSPVAASPVAACPVIVVGAGQAGLSMSWHLRARGIEHLVLEARRAGHGWREERWDSFHLVTPNWHCRLPGLPYDGDDPDGFMSRDEIVAYIDRYLAAFPPPLHEGVAVRRLWREAGAFALDTTRGRYRAASVVIATGGYHRAVVPPGAERLDAGILQLTAAQYRNPAQLPPGAALVVGTGQSGAQIAEDIHLAGRQVHLCVGPAPRVARRYRGRDTIAWFEAMGWYDLPAEAHPLRQGGRDRTNHYVSGCDGGREIDLRRRAREGMRLYGALRGIADGALRLAPDLAANLDAADRVSAEIEAAIDAFIASRGITAPPEPPYTPPWCPQADPEALDLAAAGITAIVWCIGFRADFSWVDLPVLDAAGTPVHHRGITAQPGLYFLGLPWQHSWGSGRFSGVGRDAAFLAEAIAAR